MATNSTNSTTPVMVGWQAAPLTRGTASILWNCTSVILLITWTCFHSSVGISRTQRIITTITATLVPELSALVSMRDRLLAHRLHWSLKYFVERQEWRDGWTLKKSFLVVKGGIRAGPNRSCLSGDSSYAQLVNMTADKIIDPETFLLLALMGSIRYEDFPSTEEINDKSKADWFSKVVTLVQLVWAAVNMACRVRYNCTISVMELIVLDWILYGLPAIMIWWKCPQNIRTPYTIQIQDSRMLAEPPPSSHDLHLSSMGALRDYVTNYHDLVADWDYEESFSFGQCNVFPFPLVLLRFFSHFFFWGSYQWHSAQHKTAWIVLTALSSLFQILLFFADPDLRFDTRSRSIFQNYIHPLLLQPPWFHGLRRRRGGKWLALARGMGIYSPTDLKPWRCHAQEIWHDIDLKSLVVAVLVALICQSGNLVIALMAFTNAPSGIYDVPKTWILEALVHVGG